MTINVDGVEKEIEYKGKDFNNFKVGDKMVFIEYTLLNKKKYMCFFIWWD